ncbi:MAG: class I SAM-dependent methyltransferase, partial [Bdellovibrionia bacterium]
MARYPDQFENSQGVWKSQLAIPTTYSDGEGNEQYILDALSRVSDLSCLSDELQDQIRDWPSRYHLSPLRSNLLRGFKFRPGCRILEVGSGCGAITRYLGEQGHSVLALEGAAKRAEITRLRCRDLQNVEVLNANLHDVQFQEKFDVVTLIGVLEYSAKYGAQKNLGDFLETLRWARSQLKPDGVLILAIENKFGLKYFTGCREDHTDHFFESIEGYYRPDSPRTFGRRELQKLMGTAGLSHSRFYLPFPDYKLPYVTLASREYYQDAGLDLNLSAWCDMPFESYGGRRLHLMNDQLALREMEKNGLLDEVANSFLVFSSAEPLTAE